VATLTIKTADELMALDLEDRWRARRAGRETQVSKQVLRAFLDRGGPIPVEDIAAAFRDTPAAAIRQALAALDHDDLLRVRDGQIDVAYPFSASPTPFVIRLPDGTERYACCATDALGIAPMIGQRVEIRSRCHYSHAPMALSASPAGPGPDAAGVMLWIGTRAEDACRLADHY
jgi:alkylmercury lyase-like protein